MTENILFDIEGKIKKALADSQNSKLGLEQTDKNISVGMPQLTPEPSKVEAPKHERTQEPPTADKPQTSPPTQQDQMPAYSPKKRTVNPSRLLQ